MYSTCRLGLVFMVLFLSCSAPDNINSMTTRQQDLSTSQAGAASLHFYGTVMNSHSYVNSIVLAYTGPLSDDEDLSFTVKNLASNTSASGRASKFELFKDELLSKKILTMLDGTKLDCRAKGNSKGSCPDLHFIKLTLNDYHVAKDGELKKTFIDYEISLSKTNEGSEQELGTVKITNDQWVRLYNMQFQITKSDRTETCFRLSTDHPIAGAFSVYFERGTVPFGQPIPVQKDSSEELEYESIFCELSHKNLWYDKVLRGDLFAHKIGAATEVYMSQLVIKAWYTYYFEIDFKAPVGSAIEAPSVKNGFACSVYKGSAKACGDGSLEWDYPSAYSSTSDPFGNGLRINYKIKAKDIDEIFIQLENEDQVLDLDGIFPVKYRIFVQSEIWGATRELVSGSVRSKAKGSIFSTELSRTGSYAIISGSWCYHTVVRLSCSYLK